MTLGHMFQNLLIYSPPSFIAFKFLNAIDSSFNKDISFSLVIFVHRLTNTQNYIEKQTTNWFRCCAPRQTHGNYLMSPLSKQHTSLRSGNSSHFLKGMTYELL